MASTIVVENRDSTSRAGHIAIGIVVIGLIIYWRVTGTIPLLVAGFTPEPPQGVVKGSYDFFTSVMADCLAFVGAAAVAVVSTLGKLLVEVVSWIVGKVSRTSTPAASSDLSADQLASIQILVDARIKKLFKLLNEKVAMKDGVPSTQSFELISSRIEKLEAASSQAAPAPRQVRKTTRRKEGV